MRRRTIQSGLLLPLLLGLAAFGPQQPVGHVNDRADVLPADVEATLEARLRAYEEATSVEVAVVTVESLEGATVEERAVRLFNEWGIGKRGLDNGVLFLVALADRRMRIETGYGIEPDLTDAHARRILDYEVVPLFKAEDYVAGITAGVDGILDRLGETPWAARLEARRRQAVADSLAAAERREKAGAFLNALLIVLAIVASGFGLYWLVRAGRGWLRRVRVRRHLLATEIPEASARFEEALQGYEIFAGLFAEAMPLDRDQHLLRDTDESVGHMAHTVRSGFDDLRRRAQYDPLGALERLHGEDRVARVGRWIERLADRRDVYEAARDRYPHALSVARTRRDAAAVVLRQVIDLGYRFDPAEELAEVDGTIETAEQAAERHNFEEAVRLAGVAAGSANALREYFAQLPEQRKAIDARARALKSDLGRILKGPGRAARKALTRLKTEADDSVWEPLVQVVESAGDTVTGLHDQLTDAREKNTMETQQFVAAKAAVEDAGARAAELERALTNVCAVRDEQRTARGRIPQDLEDLNQAAVEAAEACQHSDVEEATRRDLETAQEERQALGEERDLDGPTDWVALLAAVVALTERFEDIRALAMTDVADAKRRRRERNARRRRSAASSGYYGGGSSSSSSGSSFGGFGGGMSGGGGASAGW